MEEWLKNLFYFTSGAGVVIGLALWVFKKFLSNIFGKELAQFESHLSISEFKQTTLHSKRVEAIEELRLVYSSLLGALYDIISVADKERTRAEIDAQTSAWMGRFEDWNNCESKKRVIMPASIIELFDKVRGVLIQITYFSSYIYIYPSDFGALDEKRIAYAKEMKEWGKPEVEKRKKILEELGNTLEVKYRLILGSL